MVFDSSLIIEEKTDTGNWRLVQDLGYEGKWAQFVVKEGFITDLASVPKFLQSFLSRSGSYTKAAVLHDLLWRLSKAEYAGELETKTREIKLGARLIQEQYIEISGQAYPRDYVLDPVDVDGMFRRAMRLSGTNFPVRWIMWWAVRVAAIVTGRVGDMDFVNWVRVVAPVLLPIASGITAFLVR